MHPESGRELPKKVHRRLFIFTETWGGERMGEKSLLVKCHRGGAGLPFFWCGTPDDNLENFRVEFGQDRSIYYMPGIFGLFPPSEEIIQSLASSYAAEIVKVQAQGPYLLGGYCQSAMVSFEIAQILTSEGRQVGELIFLDRDRSEENFPLRAARFIFKKIENAKSRIQELGENPLTCIRGFLTNKMHSLIAHPLRSLINKLSGNKVIPLPPINTYQFSAYEGSLDLAYVKWGLLGYFQFSFFQKYWKNERSENVRFHMIRGSAHHKPDWPQFARIVNNRIRQAGY